MKVLKFQNADDILKLGIPLLIITLFLASLSYFVFAETSSYNDVTGGNLSVHLNSSLEGAMANYINGSAGNTYTPIWNNTGTVNFTFIVISNGTLGDADINNVTLWINVSGVWQGNNSNITGNDGWGIETPNYNFTVLWLNASIPDGSYQWNINATNTTEVGWNMSAVNGSLLIDTTAPTVEFNYPTAAVNLTGSSIELNVTIIDETESNGVGVNKTYVWYQLYNVSADDTPFNGNVNFTINSSGVPSFSSGELNWTNLPLVGTDDNSSQVVFYNNSINVNGTPDGQYILVINTTDVFNNSVLSWVNISIDNTPPTLDNMTSDIVNLTAPYTENTSNTIYFNVSVTGTGQAMPDTTILQMIGNDTTATNWYNVSYNDTKALEHISNGNWSNHSFELLPKHGDQDMVFRLWVNDTAGNVNTTVNMTVTVNDTVAPTIHVHQSVNVPNSVVTNANLSGNNGLERIDLTVDDQNGTGINVTKGVQISISNSSIHGNNYTVNTTLGWTNLTLSATNSSNFTFDLDLSNFADGNYTVYINATDLASNRPAQDGGNVVIAVIEGIIIDQTGPGYYNDSEHGESWDPAGVSVGGFNTSWVNSSGEPHFLINITWNATQATGTDTTIDDFVGVMTDTVKLQKFNISTEAWENLSDSESSRHYLINDTLKAHWSDGNYTNFTYNSSVIEADRSIEYRFWANDTAGNVVTTVNFTLRVNDTTPPQMNLTYMIDDVKYGSSEEFLTRKVWGADFIFNGTIDEPNLERINYTIINISWDNTVNNGELLNSSWDTSMWSNETNVSLATVFTKTLNGMYLPSWDGHGGNYTINVTAVDHQGNFNWTAFNITSEPAVSSTYRGVVTSPGYVGSGTKGEYNFTVTSKGYQYVRMYLNITNANDDNFAAASETNAKLGRAWDDANGVAIDISGGPNGYTGVSYSLTATNASAGAEMPYPYNYTNLTMMSTVYETNVTLFLNPYSGLSAGTYTGTYGFALWDS